MFFLLLFLDKFTDFYSQRHSIKHLFVDGSNAIKAENISEE